MSESRDSSVKFKTRASKGKRAAIGEDGLEEGDGMAITELSELHVGMKVEAKDKYGKLYVAKVVELREEDKEVLVHFEKWSSRYDEFIPLNSGLLYFLSQSRLEEMTREKERMAKQLSPRDRIQAKWTDGRMYFGTVVQLNDADVDLLFDDGITYTAPFSHVKKRIATMIHVEQMHKESLQLSPSAEGRRNRAEKRKRTQDVLSPPSSPLFTPAKVIHRCYFDSDSTEIESDLDDSAKIQRKSRFPKQGWVRKEAKCLAIKELGEIRSDGEGAARKTRGGIRSDGEESARKTRGGIRSDGEESARKTRGRIRSDGEESARKTRGRIRSDGEESARNTRGRIRSDGEESARKIRGGVRSEGEESARETQGGIRSDGEESARMTRGGIRSDREESARKIRGRIRNNGEESARRIRGGVRSEGEESARETQGGIRSDGEESARMTRGGIRSDREESARKIRGEVRSEGEEYARETRVRIRSNGEGPARKKHGRIRNDGVGSARKTRGEIRHGGEESARKRRGAFKSDGKESARITRDEIRRDGADLARKTQDRIRCNGEELVRKTQDRIRRDEEEPTRKTQGDEIRSDGEEPARKKPFIRNEVREMVTQSKVKVMEVTCQEEESNKPKDVGGMRPCEGLTLVIEEEDKMVEGTSSSALTTELVMDTSSAEKDVPEPKADVSSPVAFQEISVPALYGQTGPSSTQPSNSDPCSQKFRFSSRLRKTRDQSHSTSKSSSVATRTRAHTSNTVEKKLPVKQMRSTAAPAPMGFVIELDHNEFKCKVSGCTKSFRKSSLLESHIKHYHTTDTDKLKQMRRREKISPKGAKWKSHKSSPLSPLNTEAKNIGEENGPEILLSPITQEIKALLSSEVLSEPKLSADKQLPVKESLSTSEDMNTSAEKDSDKAPDGVKMRTSTKSLRLLKDETSKTFMEKEGVSVVKLSTVKDPSTHGNKGDKNQDDISTSAANMVTTTTPSSTSSQTVRKQPVIVDSTVRKELRVSTHWDLEPEPGPSEESSDDIVHCVCGSDVDEGFMIQCEDCLCWQHGDCIGIKSDVLPKKYTCYVCSNPPGVKLRLKYKYKYSEDWYGEGTLPSMPGAPHLSRAQSKAVLLSHELTDSLYRVKKMMHSSKVKLEAASNSHHPYLKQWGKECSHYSKDATMSYSMDQLLPVAYQPNHVQEVTQKQEITGQEVTAQDTITNEVELETGNGGIEGFVCTSETAQESQVEDGAEEIVSRRELRTSTLLQKQALYISPQRTRKCRETFSGNDGTPLRRDNEAIREASSGFSPLPVSSSAAMGEEGNDVTPLLPVSQASLPTVTTQNISHINTSSKPSPTPQAIDTDTMSVTPEVNLNADSSDVQENLTMLTESEVLEPGEDLMTIISPDEFGVSEVPVFAMETNRLSHLPARFLPPHSIVTMSTAAPKLPKIGCGSNSAVSNTPSFSPSVQSAFKPVPSVSSMLKLNNNTTCTMKANTLCSTPGLNFPPTRTTISEASLPSNNQPSTTGLQPVTLGEFSEAFLQGDTTNWFRRMKLLDHIESVQENVQDWLDLIGKKLTDLPDDPIMLENSDKMLSELHHTLQKLQEHQRTSS